MILPDNVPSSHSLVSFQTSLLPDFYTPPQPVSVPVVVVPSIQNIAREEANITNPEDKANNSMFCEAAILPISFQPHPYSVVVGKGREAKDNIGNKRLKVLASLHLTKYAKAANDKPEKSRIVSSVVATIREACPLGAFIRLGNSGRWYNVRDCVAREKVGYTFRELLGDKYKSSSFGKATWRTQQQHQMKRKIELIGPPAA